MILQDWANISSIITTASVITAVFSYFEQKIKYSVNEYKKTIHLITALRSQLNVIGSWAGANKGGYRVDQFDELIKNADWGDPFSLVFNLSPGNLNQVLLVPEIMILSKDLVDAITRLNQEIISFNAVLEDIRMFKFSQNPSKNIYLHLKIKGENVPDAVEVVGGLLKNEEKADVEIFRLKLVELYVGLHINHIGDKLREDNQRLHFWHHACLMLLEDAERNYRIKNRTWYRWLIGFWREEYAPKLEKK